MLSITLAAGVSVFGFVNGQAAASAQQLGGQVENQINALGEQFTFAYTYFPLGVPGDTEMNLAIYNNGQIPLGIASITVRETNTGKIATFSQSAGSACAGTLPSIFPNPSNQSSLLNPQEPPSVYTLTLPPLIPVPPASWLTAFVAGNQYSIFALAAHGYNTVEIVTK